MRVATRLVLVGIVSLLCAAAASPAQAAAPPPHSKVTLLVDGTAISTSFTPAQAVAHAQRYVKFRLHVPARLPRGMVLQDVNITSFGGNFAYATVALNYAGPGQRAFSLSESALHVSTSGGGGKVSTVRVGKASAKLVEIKTAHLHSFDLSWFTGLGYDLRTLGASTKLSRTDVLHVAASL